MRKTILICLLALALAGCGDRAQELFDTAQLEERQYNTEHAVKLYQELLEKYPDSSLAEQARQRLEELQGQ